VLYGALLTAGVQGLIASTRWSVRGKVAAAVAAALVAGLIDRQLVSPVLDAPQQDPANATLPATYQPPPLLPSA
jgi:hypothetical protein